MVPGMKKILGVPIPRTDETVRRELSFSDLENTASPQIDPTSHGVTGNESSTPVSKTTSNTCVNGTFNSTEQRFVILQPKSDAIVESVCGSPLLPPLSNSTPVSGGFSSSALYNSDGNEVCQNIETVPGFHLGQDVFNLATPAFNENVCQGLIGESNFGEVSPVQGTLENNKTDLMVSIDASLGNSPQNVLNVIPVCSYTKCSDQGAKPKYTNIANLASGGSVVQYTQSSYSQPLMSEKEIGSGALLEPSVQFKSTCQVLNSEATSAAVRQNRLMQSNVGNFISCPISGQNTLVAQGTQHFVNSRLPANQGGPRPFCPISGQNTGVPVNIYPGSPFMTTNQGGRQPFYPISGQYTVINQGTPDMVNSCVPANQGGLQTCLPHFRTEYWSCT